MIRLTIKNGQVTGISRNKRMLTCKDMIRGTDVPKKLGVTGFGRELRGRK